MAPLKFLNLLALSSIAILSTFLSTSQVSALSLEHSHIGRSLNHQHAALAKKKKRQSGKCKPRPSSSAAPASTPAPAPPAQTPAPAPSGSPPPASLSSKAGCSWANGEEGIFPQVVGSGVSWYYNWSPQKVDGDMAGREFIPQYWGTKNSDEWFSTVVPGYANHAFFLNEPDLPATFVDPGEAASLWNQFMAPLANSGYNLIGGCVSNAQSGVDWTTNFLAACPNCPNELCSHYYGIDSQDFISHFTSYNQQFGKNIWINEWACHDFSGANQPCPDSNAFMGTVVGWMQSTPFIAGFTPFGFMTPSEIEANQVDGSQALLNGDGSGLSGLGSQYMGSS